MLTGFFWLCIDGNTVAAREMLSVRETATATNKVQCIICGSTWIWTVQLLSATGPVEHCAVSVRQSGGHPTQTDQQSCDHIDRKSSAEYPQLKPHATASVLRVQVLHGVQCNLRCIYCSSKVQITKQTSSVSCLERLSMVTTITFINIIVFGLGLGLCLSNSHTIFL